LIACAEAALAVSDRTAYDVFGPPDDVKLRSSATLFERAGGPDVFARLLDRFFAGERDPATLERL
jgi:uncharacterized protein (DUF1810 family)